MSLPFYENDNQAESVKIPTSKTQESSPKADQKQSTAMEAAPRDPSKSVSSDNKLRHQS